MIIHDHLKREEFGGEFEEVEFESDIPYKSVLKVVVKGVHWMKYGFKKSI